MFFLLTFEFVVFFWGVLDVVCHCFFCFVRICFSSIMLGVDFALLNDRLL